MTSIGIGVHEHLNKEGFVTLKPGESHKYGKMSLSLWQQCTCVKTRKEGDQMIVEQVLMRPIFSGATDGSNNDHRIKYWIKKWGHSELSRHTFK